MSKYQGMALTSAALLTLFTTAVNAEFRRSEMQEAENNVYIAIGGGGGGMNTGSWDNVFSDSADPAGSATLVNQPNDKTVGVFNGMAALGYTFPGAPLRLELAYNYIGNGDFKWDNLVKDEGPIPVGTDVSASSKVFSNTIMINGYLDFIINETWAPFFMIGGGYGLNTAKLEYDASIPDGTNPPITFSGTSATKTKGNFVWNAALGVNYTLSESWTIGLAGTYFYLGKVEVNVLDPISQEDSQLFNIDRLDAFIATANLAYHF